MRDRPTPAFITSLPSCICLAALLLLAACAGGGDGDEPMDEPTAQVPGDPAAAAAHAIPHVTYHPVAADYSTDESDVPGTGTSRRDAIVMLRDGTTVGELNAFLEREGASIVASTPGDDGVPKALLLVRFPTTTASALYELTDRLRTDPIVEIAVPEVRTAPDVVTDDTNGASADGQDWKWDDQNLGGNWGLERARVPQMWNLHRYVEKQDRAYTQTVVWEHGFDAHSDLSFSRRLHPERNDATQAEHGNHVAGIVAATHDRTGTDGVNPYTDLMGYYHEHSSWTLIEDYRDILATVPDVEIVNMSMGFGWTDDGNERLDAKELARATSIAAGLGVIFAEIASTHPSVLLVTAAGNDYAAVPASINSGPNWASLELHVPNIVVVEAHDRLGALAIFSNLGSGLRGPGKEILSTSDGDGYSVLQGTSMAAPFVAGVAGYLRMLDKSLTPPELVLLLRKNGKNVDAFTSAMEIDSLRGTTAMLATLLDIDDGTADGNERVEVARHDLRADRSFEEVTGEDAELPDGGIDEGDGVIDMSDFRRWRDWLLLGEGGASLNGSTDNLKNDANGDGSVRAGDEIRIFPRGDFNGDGRMDRNSVASMPGVLFPAELSDLNVLFSSGLWDDEVYHDFAELFELIDSVDIHVSAENLFEKYDDVDEITIAPYDADTRAPIEHWETRRVTLTRAAPTTILTVPVGTRYYVASDEIELDDDFDAKVLFRSLGDRDIPAEMRGADLAVDLVRIEMTAAVKTANPAATINASDPNPLDGFVAASIQGEDPGAFFPEQPLSHGCQAWADDEGTVYAMVQSGVVAAPGPVDVQQFTNYDTYVRWQRSFARSATAGDFKFHVKPMRLRLIAVGDDEDSHADAEITIEMRAYDVSPAWKPVFHYRAEIAGHYIHEEPDGHTFRILSQEGDLDPVELTLVTDSYTVDVGGQDVVLTRVIGAEYLQVDYPNGKLPLDRIVPGHTFELRYTLNAHAAQIGFDNLAEAYVGDPLEYGTGIRTRYGDFGALPTITDISVDAAGAAHVMYLGSTGFYYVLYRDGAAVAVGLGADGPGELVDAGAPPGVTAEDYVLDNRANEQPLDLDGDGIDDVYELEHAAILDPLDPSDAAEDPDGDGRSNLIEYQQGTDPMVADGPPPATGDLYAARVVDPGLVVTDVTDLNGDGVVDLVGFASGTIVAALGLPAGDFLPPRASPLPAGLMAATSRVFADFDADGHADVAIADQLAASVHVLHGDGAGGFSAGASHVVDTGPVSLAAADVDGDGVLDLVTANGSGHSLSALIGTGNGDFADAVPSAIGAATPLALRIADMNADGRADAVVSTQQSQVAVMAGLGDGGFDAPLTVITGSDPRQLALADLDGDGAIDAATAGSQGITVLLGTGGGTLGARVDYTIGHALDASLVDLDGDGDLDIVAGPIGDQHATLVNDGHGAFAEGARAFTSTQQAFVADLDEDGVADLLSRVTNGYITSLGRGDGTFETRADYPVDGMEAFDFDVADVDGDARIDALIPDQASDSVRILAGTPGGAFVLANTVPVGAEVVALAVAQLVHDATADLAVLTESPAPGQGENALHLWLGDGTGQFSESAMAPLTDRPTRVVAGDLDGDGIDDLVVTLFFSDALAPFLSSGDGDVVAQPAIALAGRPGDVLLADVNADGRADLLGSLLDGGLVIYLAGVGGALEPADAPLPPAGANSEAVAAVRDFDGDGRVDLVTTVTGAGLAQIVLRPGLGGGAFGDAVTLSDDTGFGVPELVDVDGDGRLDIARGTEVRRARAEGGFAEPEIYWGTASRYRVLDVDGDGRVDRLGIAPHALQVQLHR